MASYFTPNPFLDEQTLGDLTKKCFLLKPSPKTLKDAAAAAAIWKALNAVYPAWFDQSVHPDACESPEVAVENMLYYMNEFLESKFQSDFDILKAHIPELLAGNPSLVLKLYEFILLISVQSDSQEIVARFMELSDTSQGVIRKVIQFYADDDESNSFSEVAALSKSWGSGVHTPQEEARGGPLAQRLQQQLAAAQQQLAAAKQQLAASETHKESILDKLKTTEQERDKERDKRITLEIQLERKKDSLLKEFTTQTDELEKTIARLKTELETEKKEKKKIEERLKQRINELQDELEVAAAGARRAQGLEVQVETYKSKLKEVPELKQTIARLEQQHKANLEKLVDASEDSGESAALKKSVELYKEKAADLEEKLVEARALGEALQLQKDELEGKVKAAEKKAEVARLTLVRKEAECDAKSFEVEALQEELEKARKIAEEAAAAAPPKAAEGDKEALAAKIAALESELDDANRVRKRLEKAQAVSLSQLQLLQQLQQQQENDKEQQQQQQQLNELVKKNAELQDAVRELTESKDQLTKQMMEAFSKSDTRAADAAEDLKVRLAAAEAQAAALQQQQQLQVDLLKAQFEKETEGALNALKEQLQIRDRESSFYRKAIEEGAEQSRREQRLLASVLYELGLQHHRLRCYCQQLKEEHEALILRLQAGEGAAGRDAAASSSSSKMEAKETPAETPHDEPSLTPQVSTPQESD